VGRRQPRRARRVTTYYRARRVGDRVNVESDVNAARRRRVASHRVQLRRGTSPVATLHGYHLLVTDALWQLLYSV